MGSVCRAFDPSGKVVAIKKIHTEKQTQPVFYDYFLSEASILSSLNHTNIIRLIDFFREDDSLYLVQEYFESNSLSNYIQKIRGPIPAPDAAQMFNQVLDAIAYAHSKNIVHKDIKTGNILIDKSNRIKVIDFGISSNLNRLNLVTSYTIAGSKFYSAPEQIKGLSVDHRADIYSLGITLWEMLSGKSPIKDEATKLFYSENPLPDPRQYYPFIPEHLCEVIKRATQLEPSNRYQNVQEFKGALSVSKTHQSKIQSVNKVVSISCGYISGSMASILLDQRIVNKFKNNSGYIISIKAENLFVPKSSSIYEHVIANLNNYVYRGLPTLMPYDEDLELCELISGPSKVVSSDLNKTLQGVSSGASVLIKTLGSSNSQTAFDHLLLKTPMEMAKYHAVLVELLKSGCLSFAQTCWQFVINEPDRTKLTAIFLAFSSFRKLVVNFLKLLNIDFPLKIKLAGINGEFYKNFHRLEGVELSSMAELDDNAISISNDATDFSRSILKIKVSVAKTSGFFQPKHINLLPFQYETLSTDQEDALRFFLRSIFRKNDFREGQLKIIKRALSGKNTIGLLPTGHGKSLCYQLLNFVQPCSIIIIDPLKSLMIDQNLNLLKYGINHGGYISSDLSASEKREAFSKFLDLQTKMLFVSPERFQSEEFRVQLSEYSANNCVGYGVIDEAHCVSEWGHDFRTSYLVLSKTLRTYCNHKGRIPTIYALTGTASAAVLDDIVSDLEIRTDEKKDAVIRNISLDRPELDFRVYRSSSSSKFDSLKEALADICEFYGIHQKDLFSKNGKLYPGLIFTPHVGNTDFSVVELSLKLAREYNFTQIGQEESSPTPLVPVCHRCQIPMELKTNRGTGQQFWGCPNYFVNGCGVTRPFTRQVKAGHDYKIKHFEEVRIYGGKAPKGFETNKWDDYKILAQDDFVSDKVPLLISTKSFGMGIDKPNIRYVVHYNLPQSLESYYQEAGRAGRDKSKSYCVIIFSDDNPEDANKRLDPAFTADEVWAFDRIANEGDVHRMLFFQKESFKGKRDEQKSVKEVFNSFETSFNNMHYGETQRFLIDFNLGKPSSSTRTSVEKSIYRLSQIGIIDDYTIDYSLNKFNLVVKKKSEDEYSALTFNHLATRSKQIFQKFNNSLTFKAYLQTTYPKLIEGCISELVDFVYRTIEPQRRRALWNLLDAARSQTGADFRKKMLRYLNPDEDLAKLLDDIPQSTDYTEWERLLNRAYDNGFSNELLGVTLRQLESYPDDVGLLYIAACLRCTIPNEEVSLSVKDFIAAFKYSADIYDQTSQENILITFMLWASDRSTNSVNKEFILSELSHYIVDKYSLLSIMQNISEHDNFIKVNTQFAKNVSTEINDLVKKFTNEFRS